MDSPRLASRHRFGSIRRPLAAVAGAALLAVPVAAQFATPATASTTSTQVVVRALGSRGDERMALAVSGTVVRSFTVGRKAADYAVTLPGVVSVRQLQVRFTNDNGPRDLTVDWVRTGGTTYQSEDPAVVSVGVWNGSSCSKLGNHRTQKLECNGRFDFAAIAAAAPTTTTVPVATTIPTTTTTTPTITTTNPGTPVVIRARGISGDEQMVLAVSGTAVRTFTVGRTAADYAVTVPGSVSVRQLQVRFTNDNGPRDLEVDWIRTGVTTHQSEDPAVVTLGVWNGSGCQTAGSHQTQRLQCNGHFDFAAVGAVAPTASTTTTAAPTTTTTAAPTTTTTAAPTTTTTAAPTTTTTAPARTGSLLLSANFDNAPTRAFGQVTDADMRTQFGGLAASCYAESEMALGDGSMRVRFQPTSVGSARSYCSVTLPAGHDELWLRYRVLPESGWVPVRGGKMAGLAGGTANTGGGAPRMGEGFSARNMWRTGGALVQYVYHQNQPGTYGEDFKYDNSVLTAGQWSTIVHRVRLNTAGQANGSITAWVDGRQTMQREGLVLRGSGYTWSIDKVMVGGFYGGSDASWAPPSTTYMRYDDVTVSTAALS